MKNLIIVILFGIFALNISAEEKITTKDGKTVILNDDFTWKYAEVEIIIENDANTNTKNQSQQQCKNLIVTDTDQITGKSLTGSKNYLKLTKDNKKGILINMFNFIDSKYDVKETIIHFTVVGKSSCIEENPEIYLLYEDNTKETITGNSYKFNCKGETTYRIDTKDSKSNLLIKKLKAIRVNMSDGSVEHYFSTKESETFKSTLNCLYEVLKQ